MLVNKLILLIIINIFVISYADDDFNNSGQKWGYEMVGAEAYMFWWLYYTTANVTFVTEKPLMIWLQGGPGSSSTGYGNFETIGPLDMNMNERNSTWVKDFNVLFIDSPVGSGFSYSSLNSIPKTNAAVAYQLYIFIQKFFILSPEFYNVPTYIASETYGGKMAVEFASLWYQNQQLGYLRSNLKGIILGDAWISPIDAVMSWAPTLYETGLLDTQGYEEIMLYANRTKDAIEYGDWPLAAYHGLFTQLLTTEITDHVDFNNILSDMYNRSPVELQYHPEEFTDEAFVLATMDHEGLDDLMNTRIKKSLNLTSNWGAQTHLVLKSLFVDFMKPVVDKVEYLLKESDLKVFVYTTQLNLFVGPVATLAWVEKLNWKYAYKWKKSLREPLVVNDIIEGYVKACDRFKMYWLNRAGNMVSNENPAGMKALLDDIVSNG